MVIVVKDIVAAADTAAQGDQLFACLKPELVGTGRDVVLSFEGIATTTSSFVNASLVELLSWMSFADIRRCLRVINSTGQINDMIKRRLEHESLLRT